MTQYQVTATYKGYIAAIVFIEAESASEAIDSAKMSISSRFNKIRAQVVGDDAEDVAPANDDLRCY